MSAPLCSPVATAVALCALVGGAGCHVVSGLDDFSETPAHGGGAGGVGGAIGGMGGGGGAAAEYGDRGLVLRYFIDEATMGNGPMELVDAAADPLPLPITYANNLAFVGEDGHRGLLWDTGLAGGEATTMADDTKVFERLDGATAVTLEAVVEARSFIDLCPRIFNLGIDADNVGKLGLCTDEDEVGDQAEELELRVSDVRVAQWPFDLTGRGRTILHVVWDASEQPAQQARLFVDGAHHADAQRQDGAVPRLELSPGSFVTVGNRPDGMRSFPGGIFYVAVYDEPFTAERVRAHATRLEMRDDR